MNVRECVCVCKRGRRCFTTVKKEQQQEYNRDKNKKKKKKDNKQNWQYQTYKKICPPA